MTRVQYAVNGLALLAIAVGISLGERNAQREAS